VEAAFSLCLMEQPATDGDGASASASAPAPASSSSSSAGAGGAAAPRARALALAPLLSASELVKEGYAVLYSEGMISRTLRDDLQHNLTKLAEAAARGSPAPSTARAFVVAEFAAAGRSPEAAKGREGLIAGLWLSRTLRFVARMLQLLGQPRTPAVEIAEAGRTTYDEILHPYHGPLLGFIVGAAFSWAPRRKTLTDQLRDRDGLDEAAATALLARAAAAMLPVTQALHDLFTEHGIDWPDKVGV
jgi:hypothetical protein